LLLPQVADEGEIISVTAVNESFVLTVPDEFVLSKIASSS
jgi:hypothetical protein